MKPSRRIRVLSLITLVSIVGTVYAISNIAAADGRLVAPLDDAYITFQYARQIAQGQPYRYNDGDPPTTGMTSPLFGFLLAGFYALGLTDEHVPAIAVLAGIIWLGLIAWLVYRITERLMSQEKHSAWPWAASGFTVLIGAVQWGCFNGMETGLFTVLTLAALDAYFSKRIRFCALWLGLAGLTRPEGLVLSSLIWIAFVVEGIVSSHTIRWTQLALLSVAVTVGLVPSGVNWMLTGTASSSGLLAKSWLLNIPRYPEEIIRSVGKFYQRIMLERFLGWAPIQQWFIPPGFALLAIVGWLNLLKRRYWMQLAVTTSWFLVGTLSTATLITAFWHRGRYQVPFAPIVIVLAVYGLASLHRQAKQLRHTVPLLIVTFFLLSTSMFSTLASVDVYRDAVNTLINQHIAVADWVRNNLPHDVRVGVHDAGVIRYYGGHPTYDLIGLTTAEGAIPWRHGSGSVFELMEQSQMRPAYLAIYPDVFSIPYLAMTDIFAEELFRTEVPDYAVTSAGPVQGVWRADWTLADSGAKFYQPDILSRMKGLTLVDTLDVADLDDEAAHQVEWWHDARRPGFPTEVQQMSYRVSPEQVVLDGGRLLTGGIAFDVVTNPGEPLWLIARLHAHEAGAVEVKVNGHTLGMWRYPPVPGQWLETAYHVPATMITAQETHVQLSADGDYPGFLHYAPYSYWFLQGEPDNAQPQIAHHVAASFGEDINLMGFDLTKQVWHPGDIVPVTCYWTTVASTPSDAKVFLHLYNTEGNLGPQSDGWAFYGTRAPYTWTPNETVADPRLLALPADMEPGIYSIEVGLYLPDEATRLTAYLNGDRQHKDRVQLVTIEVEE